MAQFSAPLKMDLIKMIFLTKIGIFFGVRDPSNCLKNTRGGSFGWWVVQIPRKHASIFS